MNILDQLGSDKWYGYDGTGDEQVFCGECMIQMVKDTQSGKHVDDEAIDPDSIYELKDAASEPYQCDNCLKQNAAYEEAYGD